MEPNEIEDFLNKLAREIVDRHLTAPAIVLLESSKPLSFIGNQTMVFFQPIINLFIMVKDYDKYSVLLEDRENVEKLICAIERYEEEKISAKKGKS
ncbi:MAG: hypothetical protein LWY06_00020 [Firmicutes bacterium]|nr:hypothetical protein [Bacillota bacterium]